MKDVVFGSYRLTDQRRKLRTKDVMRMLSLTYWAKQRDRATTKRCLKNSKPFGVLDASGKLVGFARLVTDCATFYYLADVILAPEARGQGVAHAFLDFIFAHEEECQGRGVLLTQTAHGLYEKVGFRREACRAMVR